MVAAGAGAVCYGVATVLQAIGARRTPRAGLHVRLLARLARQLPYVVGLVLDLAGFVLVVVALHSLPLSPYSRSSRPASVSPQSPPSPYSTRGSAG